MALDDLAWRQMRRQLALLLVVPVALLLSACGGSGGETSSATGGGETVATAGDAAADPFAQLRFVLGKFPYEPWYRECLIEQVEAKLSAGELEELAKLPREQGRRVALRFALGAAPKCEQQGRKPIVAGATKVQVQLLRIGYATTLEALGKREGLSASQASCLSTTISKFPDAKVIALGNASQKRREAMLVGVIEACAT
jgi:hypothetical protein